jgi:hypothetical protein
VTDLGICLVQFVFCIYKSLFGNICFSYGVPICFSFIVEYQLPKAAYNTLSLVWQLAPLEVVFFFVNRAIAPCVMVLGGNDQCYRNWIAENSGMPIADSVAGNRVGQTLSFLL